MMSANFFYTNILDGAAALANSTIALNQTNLDTNFSTVYVKKISDTNSFREIGFNNQYMLKQFYENVVLRSTDVSTTSNYNLKFINSLSLLNSDLNSIFFLTKYTNPAERSCIKFLESGELYTGQVSGIGDIYTSGIIPSHKFYNIRNQTFDKITFGLEDYTLYLDSSSKQKPYTEVREYEGIFLKKSHINVSGVWKETNPWDFDDDFTQYQNKIYSQYQKAKIYSYVVKNYNYTNSSFYYSTFLFVIVNDSSDEELVQNYKYSTGRLNSRSSVEVNKSFFPYSFILDNNSVDQGYVFNDTFTGYESTGAYASGESGLYVTGSGLIKSGQTYAYPGYCKNISGDFYYDPSTGTGFLGTNTMGCSWAGHLMIQYESGVIIKTKDPQLCGVEEKTVFIKPINIIDTPYELYKDLPDINNAITLYGYNFTDIEYVKNDESTESIVSIGSAATETQKYTKPLKTSNYFSYSFNPKLGEEGFIFTYNFKGINGSNVTNYIFNISPLVKAPTVNLYKKDLSEEVIVTTNYGSTLEYWFNNETATTVAITDTTDGTNQKTAISTANKTGNLNVRVKNFFFDLDDSSSKTFQKEASILLNQEKTISNFQFTLSRAASTQTIYDASGAAITTISETTLYQESFSSYTYYSIISSSTSYRINLTYAGEDLLIQVGDNFTPQVLASGNYLEFTKSYFESLLDQNKRVEIKFIKSNGIEFVLPLTVKTYYSTTPSISNQSISNVIASPNGLANVALSFDYTSSTDVFYEILNQNSNVIFSSNKYLDYSTSSQTKNITLTNVPISSATSLSVRITAKSLFQSSGVETIRTSTATTSSETLPLRLSNKTPAAIKIYSDSGLSNEIFSISKDVTAYIKMCFYDVSGSLIPVNNYSDYIIINNATPTLEINGSSNPNLELNGVTLTKINSYTYSLLISSVSDIKLNQLSLKTKYNGVF